MCRSQYNSPHLNIILINKSAFHSCVRLSVYASSHPTKDGQGKKGMKEEECGGKRKKGKEFKILHVRPICSPCLNMMNFLLFFLYLFL